MKGKILGAFLALLLMVSSTFADDVITLAWTHPDPASIDGFQIFYQFTDSGEPFKLLATVDATTFTYTLTQTPGKCVYSVRAFAGDADSLFSKGVVHKARPIPPDSLIKKVN